VSECPVTKAGCSNPECRTYAGCAEWAKKYVGHEFECPRCRTVYFVPMAECDWCDGVTPVPVKDSIEDKEGC
jgi:hypothetical protein